MALHNEIGKIGEDIAVKWLTDNGFSITERNYRKKWGEIDIVARGTSGIIHFVEVKTVSHETSAFMEGSVLRGTWRPEEHVDQNKQDRLKRAIRSWLLEHQYTGPWQIDILAIRIVPREKKARVKYLDNVIFE